MQRRNGATGSLTQLVARTDCFKSLQREPHWQDFSAGANRLGEDAFDKLEIRWFAGGTQKDRATQEAPQKAVQ